MNIHWKDWCWSCNSNSLITWCKEATHWKIPWCWKRLKAKEKRWQRMRWWDGISDSMNIYLSKLWDTVKDKGAWYVAVHGVTKTWTQLRDWTTTTNQNDPFQIKLHFCAQNYSSLLFHSQWNKVLSGLWTHMSCMMPYTSGLFITCPSLFLL